VVNIVNLNGNFLELTPAMKKSLLNLPAMDVIINQKPPLQGIPTAKCINYQ
jgi:hypothetical protein